MDRNVLLVALVALLCGPIAWATGPVLLRHRGVTGRERERAAWHAMMLPLVCAGTGMFVLLGWALREPALADERLTFAAWVIIVLVSAIWIRATIRLVRSNARSKGAAIGVVGLVGARIVVDPEIAALLDEDALAAAMAHEEAHRRHRDPLRIAIGQLATDLQWPWRQARSRMAEWRAALEEARDDEAIETGADPHDLAAAILAVAKHAGPARGAALTGTAVLASRIARLLAGSSQISATGRSMKLAVTGLFVIALVVGLTVGDDLIGLLPGVVR